MSKNFESLAVPAGLDPEERVMEARAKEIVYFSSLLLDHLH